MKRLKPLPGGEIRRASLVIAAQTIALILVLFATVGGAFFLIYHHSLDSDETSTLTDATTRIDRPSEAPPGVWVTILEDGHLTESSGLPEGLPDMAPLHRVAARGGVETVTTELHGQEFLISTQRVGARTTQAAMSLQQREDEEQRVLGAITLAALLAVVLAGGASILLARRAVRPLSEALERQRRFVADASHELRTPLTHLSTRVQLLRRREAKGLDTADLDALMTDTNALTEILNDLLAASDTGRQPRTMAAIDALVTACADAARPYAMKGGIALEVDVASGPEIAVVPPALRRAVTALIDNAIDHARAKVTVTLHFNSRAAVIDVADDGSGIAPEVMPHIFERFRSARPSRAVESGARRHYGIGLALVADIAAAHHGRVEVITPGDHTGTTFRLTIPQPRS